MESRVAGVKVVGDFGEKEVWCAMASSANLSRRCSKSGTGRQSAGHFVDLAVHDMSNELKKHRLHLWRRFLFRLTVSISRSAQELSALSAACQVGPPMSGTRISRQAWSVP